jgi:hypothetical protein
MVTPRPEIPPESGRIPGQQRSAQMKLLILGHNYAPELTGIGPYTTELAGHLAASGHSVTVLTTFPHYPRYRWEGKPGWRTHQRVNGVDVRRLRVLLPRKPKASWRILPQWQLLYWRCAQRPSYVRRWATREGGMSKSTTTGRGYWTRGRIPSLTSVEALGSN